MSKILIRGWGKEQSIEEIAAVTANGPSHLSPRQNHTYKSPGGKGTQCPFSAEGGL